MGKIVKEVIHANGIDIGIYTEDFQNEYMILPAIFEPPVRTFGATIPVFESQLFQ